MSIFFGDWLLAVGEWYPPPLDLSVCRVRHRTGTNDFGEQCGVAWVLSLTEIEAALAALAESGPLRWCRDPHGWVLGFTPSSWERPGPDDEGRWPAERPRPWWTEQ